MEIGILTQGYVRRDGDTHSRIREVIAEARKADEVGLASFAVSEQHFKFPTNSTGPITAIMAAIAQCTEQIMITPGAVIVPFHHPLVVAEEWAGIDIISKGRLFFGAGKGNTPLTADTFKVPIKESGAIAEEALEVIVKAWTQDKFAHEGKYFRIPEISVTPKPVQKPHPRIGFGTTSVEGATWVGSRQLGLMTGATCHSWGEVESFVKAYDAAWKTGAPMPHATPEYRKSFLVHGHVARDFNAVKEELREGLMQYVNRAVDYIRIWNERRGAPTPDYGANLYNNFDAVIDDMPTVFGTPDRAIEKLLRMKAMGFDRVDVCLDYAPHDEILRCIELLGKEVAPALKDSAPRASSAA